LVFLPPVLAAGVWDLLSTDLRDQLSLSSPVVPQYTRLVMGSSHSVNILMAIVLAAASAAFHSSAQLAEDALTHCAQGLSRLAVRARLFQASGCEPRRPSALWLTLGIDAPIPSVAANCSWTSSSPWFVEHLCAKIHPDWLLGSLAVQDAILDLLDSNVIDGLVVLFDAAEFSESEHNSFTTFSIQIADRLHRAGGVFAIAHPRDQAHLGTPLQDMWTYLGERVGYWASHTCALPDSSILNWTLYLEYYGCRRGAGEQPLVHRFLSPPFEFHFLRRRRHRRAAAGGRPSLYYSFWAPLV
jgi:hypothetical protein